MKRKQLVELHQKTPEALKQLLVEARENFLKLKMEMASGKIKDLHTMAKTKDDLARILTILREKKLENSK